MYEQYLTPKFSISVSGKMSSSVVPRRQTAPNMVQKIWAAITYIRHQRQIANTERIMRYMQRSFEISQSEAKLQLHNAVNDNLVERYTYVGTKGTKSGVEQEGFRIHDGHDLVRKG